MPREGKPPYFWTILTRPEQRVELLREGWKADRILVMAPGHALTQGLVWPTLLFTCLLM